MEDKINQITEQMNQIKAKMDERMDQVLNGYQNQIDDLRNQYDSRIEALEAEGLSSSDIYMDEQLVNLNNEITRLTNEADKVFEDLNKELNKKLEDLNKQLDFEEDKARRVGEKNKELDARMSELEKQGMSYGEMQLDPEVIRLQNEIEIITNELSEEEIAKREEARKQAEEKQKQEKEKNNAIKEYANLKEQKADLDTKLKEAKKQLEEQNASLEKEKAGRLEAMKQLEARNNTNSPEYKEYVADIKRIEELLSENSKKAKIDEFTKNIADIETRMTELEGKFGKEVLEPVIPEPESQQPIPEPQPQQSVPEPEPRQYGRRMNSPVNPTKSPDKEDKGFIQYEDKPLFYDDYENAINEAFAMMDQEDIEFLKTAYQGSKNGIIDFENSVIQKFPMIFDGYNKEEQRLLADIMLKNIDGRIAPEEKIEEVEPVTETDVPPVTHIDIETQQKGETNPVTKIEEQKGVGKTKLTDEEKNNLLSGKAFVGASLDISTGEFTAKYNIGGEIYSRTIDFGESCVQNGISFRDIERDGKKNGEYQKNMDPIFVLGISQATQALLKSFDGIRNYDIKEAVYNIMQNYNTAINNKEGYEELAENIQFSYEKSDLTKVCEDYKGVSLEKQFGKYMRKYINCPEIGIDEQIDTRNWLEKLTDKIRGIFNPQNKLLEESTGSPQEQPKAQQGPDLSQQLQQEYRDYKKTKPDIHKSQEDKQVSANVYDYQIPEGMTEEEFYAFPEPDDNDMDK